MQRPLLLVVALSACLPPENDEAWSPPEDTAPDTVRDTAPDTDDTDDTDDAPTCTPSTPPPALSPSAPGDDGAFTLLELGPEETSCVVVEDLDRDGRADVVLLQPAGDTVRVDLRVNTGDRTFRQVVRTVTLEAGVEAGGCTVDDVDDDGDLDVLWLTSVDVRALVWQGDRLVDGGVVADLDASVAEKRRTPELIVPVDLDHQGRLDLVVGHHAILSDECPDPETVDTGDVVVPPPAMDSGTVGCLVATGDLAYGPAPAGLCPSPMLTVPTVAPYGAEVGDFDDDGDADLLIVADFSENRLFEGTPAGLVPADGVGLDVYNHAMGVASDDLDGDGQLDFFVTDLGPSSVYLGQCGAWFDGSRSVGLWRTTRQTVTWGVQAVDLDLNGASDLVVGVSVDASGSDDPASMCIGPEGASTPHPPTMLLMNAGGARFTRYALVDTTTPAANASGRPSRVAVGDLDGDLDADVVVSTGEGTSILWNDLPKQSDGLRVHPVDAEGRPAIGARVVVEQGAYARHRDLWRSGGMSSTSEGVVSFALAGAGEPTVKVRWPDGTWTTHGPYPEQTQDLTLQQP